MAGHRRRPVTGADRPAGDGSSDHSAGPCGARSLATEDEPPAVLRPDDRTLWSGGRASDDGVRAANLLREPARHMPAARRFATGDIGPIPPRQEDKAVLTVLGTASDDRLSQLRAGEALSAVLLTATTLGPRRRPGTA